ncbi:helix-turn-helix domain-containing protein [Acetobacter tropicalis]|uniref:Transcriptional regulator, IclR family n=1 Tax=Acetobacter tropicalis TaxID=104102 RepID=A0A094YNP0_9PROT|nr:IclR family transcriptional regulator C-terminal domain-containing protein [Acetobacter tropicalis]KAA8385835.1 helix-turn-helix domain-containing protein [Acetobacter tropicalis]KAA8391586.1 helix-turn-helix domain-containing protein [Acetobacter tropicalis]KGB22219.1 transcriptional regulator, IclR family [Acetobacter tropicalis]MBC9008748.1 helix-turn-helix domain-containing protein [Acetobacter tropicalis]MDO8173143.1 IclR family transcriptional regulator C-terminal domain-containing pr
MEHIPNGLTDDPVESRDFVTALARGLDVLKTCSDAPDGLTLSDVARKVNLPRAAVRRALLTLVATGYLAQNGRLFQSTPRVLDLSGRVSDLPLPRLAQPILNQLSHTLGESASLAILDGQDILYIARSEARRILAVDLTVGGHLPAWCTSMGRVLLAGLSEPERLQHLPPVLEARTSRTITDFDTLHQHLKQIRSDGYCVQDQELEAGLRSVAAPVLGHKSKVVAALNVSTQATRTPLRELKRYILPAVIDAAAALGQALRKQQRIY